MLVRICWGALQGGKKPIHSFLYEFKFSVCLKYFLTEGFDVGQSKGFRKWVVLLLPLFLSVFLVSFTRQVVFYGSFVMMPSRLLIKVLLVSMFFVSHGVFAKTIYVNAVSGSDSNDGQSVEGAFLTLQAAVDAAEDGDTVLAAPGMYDQGGRAAQGESSMLTNRVCVEKALTLRSSGGPEVTFVVGEFDVNTDGIGPAAVRGLYANTAGTLISGFTFTNGYSGDLEWDLPSMGGGAWLGSDNVIVSNCIFDANHAFVGGGSYQGKHYDCVFKNNTAGYSGGGSYSGYAYNCIFTGNSASQGGATHAVELYHCTVVGNSANDGGGAQYGNVYNSIVFYNQAPFNPNCSNPWNIEFSCTDPIPEGGTGVINTPPRFADTNNWSDLHLTEQSLCIDAGDSKHSKTSADFDNNVRIAGGGPDLGAYEWPDAGLPVVSFASSSSTVQEDTTEVSVEVVIFDPSEVDQTFNLSYNGTATSGVDYSDAPPSVTISAGATSAWITLAVINDAVPEYTETLDVSLQQPAGFRVGYAQHALTIEDNDGMPQITYFSVNDGGSGTDTNEVALALMATFEPEEYRASESADFSDAVWQAYEEEVPLVFTLSSGYGQKMIYVQVRKPYEAGHVVSEPTSSSIYLGPSVGVAVEQSSLTFAGDWFGIVNTNALGGSLARSAVFSDGHGWSTLASTVSSNTPQRITFDYWVLDGAYFSFSANNEYMNLPHGLSGGPFHGEMILEVGENNLSWEAGGAGGYAQLDNIQFSEAPPLVYFVKESLEAEESEGSVQVDLQLGSPNDAPLTIHYTVDGTAEFGADFTLSPTPTGSVVFATGETNAVITVQLTDDITPEVAETIQLTIESNAFYRAGFPEVCTLTVPLNDNMTLITTFSEQNDRTAVDDVDVVLTLIAENSPQEYRISENEDFSGAIWTLFSANPAFTLSEGYGDKTLWVETRKIAEDYGYAVSPVVSLTLTLQPPLAFAMNLDEAETDTSFPWFGQTVVSRDGAAGQSGKTTSYNQQTWASATLSGSGTISFYWKFTSSYFYNCYLTLYADGSYVKQLYSETDWQKISYTFETPGEHTLRWQVSSYYPATVYNTSAYVDQVDLSSWTFSPVAVPTFSPVDETVFESSLEISLSCATTGAEIRYTLDESEPTQSSPLYEGAFVLTETTTVKARGFKDGQTESEISTATYRKSIPPPTLNPPTDTAFYPDLSVALSHPRPDVEIRYTLDGTEPIATSPLYSAPLFVTNTALIKASAFADGLDPSAASVGAYTLSDIPRALDVPHMVLRMSDTNAWHYQTEYAQDGKDAARSKYIESSESTWMETDIQTPARVLFGWKVSSYYEYLTLYTNGVMHSSIYSNTDWTQFDQVFETEGNVTLRWTYARNYSNISGQNAGFVDRLRIISTNACIADFETAEHFVQEIDGTVQVKVTLDQPTDSDLMVPFTVSGTASDGADYTLTTNAFTIPAGTNSAVVTVTLIDDGAAEMNETIVLTLTETEHVSPGSVIKCTFNILPNGFASTEPGLIGWWRADSGAETNETGCVMTWLDLSGYRNHFTQSVTNRAPLLTTDTMHGKPAVRFDLTDDSMISILSLPAPYTIHMIFSSGSEATGLRPALQGSSRWYVGLQNNVFRHQAGWSYVNDGTVQPQTNRLYLCTVRNDGTNSLFSIDGDDKTVTSGQTGSPGILHFGASGYYSSSPFGGDLVEILVYDRALDDDEISSTGSGPANEYGIETLYDPASVTITTASQTLPEGTSQLSVEGTVSGTANELFWTNTVSELSGVLSIASNGSWQVNLPLNRGVNQFEFSTRYSDPATLTLTVDGRLEPFAVASKDSGELRISRWRSDSDSLEEWKKLDDIGSGYVRALTVGDYNADGFDDILAFRTIGSGYAIGLIYFNRGDNTFEKTQAIRLEGPNNSYIMRAATGDFNEDGHADVIVTTHQNNLPLLLLEGDGTGRFTQRTVPMVDGYGRGIVTADFDHDGHLDIAASFYSSGKIYVAFGRGDSTFEPALEIGVSGSDPYGLVAGDFNQDGHPDLICRSGGSAPSQLFAGTGDRSFGSGETVDSLALNQHAGFAAYDFTEDGRPDLVAATVNQLQFLRATGDNTFTQEVSTVWSSAYGVAATPLEPPDGTPQIELSTDHSVISVGEAIQFSADITCATISSNLWDFGDGTQTAGSVSNISHTFTESGRYTVRLHAVSDEGIVAIVGAQVSVTGSLVTVLSDPVVLQEADAVNGQWELSFNASNRLSGADASTRFFASRNFEFSDGFEGGTLDSQWTTISSDWQLRNDSQMNGAALLAQTNTSTKSTLLLDTPQLSGTYKMSTILRFPSGTTTRSGLIFAREANGYEFCTAMLNNGSTRLELLAPNGSMLVYPLGFTLQPDTNYKLSIELTNGLAQCYLDDQFLNAVPYSGNPAAGLIKYSGAVLFDDFTFGTSGPLGTGLESDLIDDFESASMSNWQINNGSWVITTNTPTIGGSHSLRQNNVSTYTAFASYQSRLLPLSDFTFETDVSILAGSGEQIKLRLGTRNFGIYYDFVISGAGQDKAYIYRNGSLLDQTALTPGWLQPGTPFKLTLKRKAGRLIFYHNDTLLLELNDHPDAIELPMLAIGTSYTDVLFDNIKLASAGSSDSIEFPVNAAGASFTLAALGADGVVSTGQVNVTIGAQTAPAISVGGPYSADESMATNGGWRVNLDQATASDAESGILSAVWTYGTDSFDGEEIDDGKWLVHSSVIQSNALLFPSGLSTYAISRATYSRAEAQRFEGRIKINSGYAYLGFKTDSEATQTYNIKHGLYLTGGSIYVYQNGTTLLSPAWQYGVWYRVRIELHANGGASYWMRPDTDDASWMLLHENFTVTDATFRKAVIAVGDVAFDDFVETDTGIQPDLIVHQGGITPLSFSVRNHAGVESVASGVLTCSGETAPQAPFNFDRTINEVQAQNGIWSTVFDASAATDDQGIWKIDWDWDYHNETGFRASGTTGILATNSWNAVGTYIIAARVTDHARQTVLITGTITISEPQAPTANAGGPYLFNESVATNGTWNVEFDGSGSTTPVGIVEQYLWDVGYDEFDSEDLFGRKWVAEASVALSNGVLVLAKPSYTPASSTIYAYDKETIQRTAGQVIESRLRFHSGSSYGGFGLRSVGANNSFNSMPYMIMRYSSSTYVVENGIWRHCDVSLSPDVWYDFRIELKHDAGAIFYYKIAENEEWIKMYESDNGTATAYHRGWQNHSSYYGFDVERVRECATGATPNFRFYPPAATNSLVLTVRNAAGLTHSTTTTVETVCGTVPVAQITPPAITLETDSASAGIWRVSFSSADSTDDYGLLDYEWDFDYEESAGFRPSDVGLPEPSWMFTELGQHNVALRVQDHLLQTSELAFCTVTLTAAGTAPEAVISPDVPEATELRAESGWTVRFDGSASTSDEPLASYFWDFGDGTTGEGNNPLHRYPSNGTYTVSLVVMDDAGRRSAPAEFPVVIVGSTVPTADAGVPTDGGINGPPVYFDASRSSDAAAPGIQQGIVSYWWDADINTDSDSDGNPANDIDAVGINPEVTYSQAGSYSARLIVTDGAGQSATNTVSVTVLEDAPPQALIPWIDGDPDAAHPVVSGESLRMKGLARDSGTLRYQWIYGDGNETGVLTTGNPTILEQSHIYSGQPGDTFAVTLRVWDAADHLDEAVCTVEIVEDTAENRTAIAVNEGLWWLYKDQNKSTGRWTSVYTGWKEVESAGAAISAFQKNGHRLEGNVAADPYVKTVRMGYDWLFAQLTSVADDGTFDLNGNGFTLKVNDSYANIPTARSIRTLAASQSWFAMAETGEANVRYRHFCDLAQDLTEYIISSQRIDGNNRGGWNRWSSSADTAGGMHMGPALRSAQQTFGIMIPNTTLSELEIWLTNVIRPDGAFGNTNPYPQDSYDLWAGTAGGMNFSSMLGDSFSSNRWKNSERWFDDQAWPPNPDHKQYMMLWGLSTALRDAAPHEVETLWYSGRDWFNDPVSGLRSKLLDEQESDGKWSAYAGANNSDFLHYAISTALAVDMLSGAPAPLRPRPVISASRYWAYGVELTLDASLSSHPDPTRSIVRYEWDVDGDDVFDFDVTTPDDPSVIFLVPDPTLGTNDPASTNIITLRVTDDAPTPRQVTITHSIEVGDSPFTPVALSAGPYLGLTNLAVTVNGSESYDLDNQPDMQDGITEWQWDFDMDGTPDVITNSAVATWSWPTAGTYTIRLRVLDDGLFNEGVKLTSEWSEATVEIVNNRKPDADAGGPYSGEQYAPITFSGSASQDPDPGQSLTQYAWDFTGDTVADVVTNSAIAEWTFNESGNHTVWLRVQDEDGLWSDWTGGSVSVAEVIYYTISTATSPESGAGTVTAGASLRRNDPFSATATLTNSAKYVFSRWTFNGGTVSYSPTYSVSQVQAEGTLTAVFDLARFNITASVSPVGFGHVSGAGWWSYGVTNTLTANPATGCAFVEWRDSETYETISTELSYSFAVTQPKGVIAVFREINSSHTITTVTQPAGLTTITGAGNWNNGQTAVFGAPEMVVSGEGRYLFSRFKVNGTYASTANPWSWTLSRSDPVSAEVQAEYTAYALSPTIRDVRRTYNSPIPAVTNQTFTIVFDRSMDTSIAPEITISNRSTAAVQPVPSGGIWQRIYQDNDSYRSPTVSFGGFDDGSYALNVALAEDAYGSVMTSTNAWTFDVDASAPDVPLISVTASNEASCTVGWADYAAPADLNGFRVYLSEATFTNIVDLTPRNYLWSGTRAYTVSGLALDTSYWIAVMPIDRAGNMETAVTPLEIRLPRAIPPQVNLTVQATAGDAALLDWSSFSGNSFGFAGFYVYQDSEEFQSVSNRATIGTLAKNIRSYALDGLDRTITNWFAVVGFNNSGEKNNEVIARSWSDPYRGTITEDTVMGAAGVTTDVLGSLTVANGATLTVPAGATLSFARGAGIVIEEGLLVANGTALNPIIMTSADPEPQEGDWAGIVLQQQAGNSVLRHVRLEYSAGLIVSGCAPELDALSALYNTTALRATAGGELSTVDALLLYNSTALLSDGNSTLQLNHSIVRNNQTNAANEAGSTLLATNVWWGSAESTVFDDGFQGTVEHSPYLIVEPVLTPAADAVGGNRDTGTGSIDLNLAARVAEAVQISEDSMFAGSFYDSFEPIKTVNLSAGGGLKTLYIRYRNAAGEVSETVSVSVNYITAGPQISSCNIEEGSILTRPFVLTASAFSALGVEEMRVSADESIVALATNGALSVLWDIRDLEPGTRRIFIEAVDTAGNLSTRAFNVTARIEPPPNPSLSAPADELITTNVSIIVSGSAEAYAEVSLRRNGAVVQQITASEAGAFSASVPLVEGENELVATVSDPFGTGRSGTRRVTRDSGSPAAPGLEDPSYEQGAGLRFGWLKPAEGEVPTVVALLRADTPFTQLADADWQGKWNTDNPIVETPPTDGVWYYALVGRDNAGNLSELSNVITNSFDSTSPTFSISYNKTSPTGTGLLEIELTSSEPISGLPVITVQPAAASGPTMLTVSNTAPSRFGCRYNVQSVAGSGPLVVRVSGSDFAGNRSVPTAPSGLEMVLDTTAPVGILSVSPSGLVQVTNTITMEVALQLNEPSAGTPELRFIPPESAAIDITLSGSGTNWMGQTDLFSLMGSGMAGFALTVTDPLGNTGSTLNGTTQIELYNTTLPEPPPAVTDLRASTDQSDGNIQLAWLAVPEAESYSLYRQDGSAGSLPDELVSENITDATFEDLPPADGFYRYVVYSERRNSSAAPSPEALGLSDRTPPPAPTNLTASLSSSGVRVEWDYSTEGEQPDKFRLYRNGTLLRDRISADTRYWIDNPARGSWTYVVASVDRNGNEILSNDAEIDMQLPGVTRTDVLVGTNGIPRISWQVRAEHSGVNLYRNGSKLNDAPLTGTVFSDSGLTGSDLILYEVRGVNSEGTESAGRQLPVFHLEFGLSVNPESESNALIDYFDLCRVNVTNRTDDSTFEASELQLTRTVAGSSISRTVPQSASTALEAVLPCTSAGDIQTFSAQIIQALDDPSASVSYQAVFETEEAVIGGIEIQITVEDQPVAGAACTPKARIFNHSQVPVDLVMWRNDLPGDLSVLVLDENQTEVSKLDIMMPKSSLIATPDSQRGFRRISAGDSVEFTLPEIIIPEALGESETAFIRVDAAHIYHECGQSTEQISGPLSGRLRITPKATSYTALGQPDRAAYFAGDTMTVSGYAYDRESGDREPNVPVHVGLALDGFAWFVEAVTDENGDFSVERDIPQGISGTAKVWASHPQVHDRLNQAEAAIYQAYFRPGEGSVRMAANDELTLRLNAYNPGSFMFTNLTSEFTAWQVVDGVTNVLSLSSVSGAVHQVETLSLPPRELVPIELKLNATEDVLPGFNCRFEIVTPEGARVPFDAVVTVTTPLPLITVTAPSKGYVDMSLNRGSIRSTDVELRNDGFKTLQGVRMTAPVIPWMQVALTPEADGSYALPDLAPGDLFTFQVVYTPDDSIDLDYYSDRLFITGTNSVTETHVNLYSKITSESRGRLAFQINNSLGQTVPDASVRLRSALDGTERTGFRTDSSGYVEVPDLMEGRWHWQVSASGHATQAGTTEVEADLTTSVEAELYRELVTVKFSVVPVPFTDRYEIKIEQTFSTYVPAPVLVVDPIYTDFGTVAGPFTHTFTATAKNHGLIKMTDFTVEGMQLPNASIIPAISYLPELAPMQQIEIPYTVTYLGENGASSSSSQSRSSRARKSSGGEAPQYNPCTDDFMESVLKLISYLNGRYGSMSGTKIENIKRKLSFLVSTAEDKAPVNLSPMYQWLFCLADVLGSSSGGSGGDGYAGGGGGGGFPSGGGGCFAAGTPVLLADGSTLTIEAIKPGDVVRTGPERGDIARVTETFKRPAVSIRELRLKNGTVLKTTDEHRIWVDGTGWTLAKDIQAGDWLAGPNDTILPVEAVRNTGRTEDVFTFELHEDIAFYADGVLVRHLCGVQFPNLQPTHDTPARPKGGAR